MLYDAAALTSPRVDGRAKVTGAGQIRRRVQRAWPRLWQRRRFDRYEGPHRAHRRQRRRLACAVCSTCSPTRTARTWRTTTRPITTTWRRRGSPFRPLYDDKIKFNGQPVGAGAGRGLGDRALRGLAGARRIQGGRITSPTCMRGATRPSWSRSPRSRAAMRERAYAAAGVRHEAEYFIPIEHHNPMELFAATVVWDGDGKLTVYDKTQGVQNVQRYLCGVFGLKPEDVRGDVAVRGRRLRLRLAPAIPGRAGGRWQRRRSSARCASCSPARRCTGSAIGPPRSSAWRSAPSRTGRSTPSPTRRSR